MIANTAHELYRPDNPVQCPELIHGGKGDGPGQAGSGREAQLVVVREVGTGRHHPLSLPRHIGGFAATEFGFVAAVTVKRFRDTHGVFGY